MTGPATGGLERGTGAPTRTTGTQGAVGAILIVLALGLALRLIIAYLLPGSGFEGDLNTFRAWADNLAEQGLYGFYERDFFHDYTPGYLYVLYVVGVIGNAVGGIGDLIKVPPAIADLAIGWLVWSMVRELGGRDRLALLAAAVAVVNPISWFDSIVWGQVDSFGVVFLLLALRALWRDRPERAAVFTVIAAVIKPQLGILVPLIAVVTIRRALWPVRQVGPGEGGSDVRPATVGGRMERLGAWESRTGHPLRILTTGLAGYLTAVVLCLPFGLSVLEPTTEAPFLASGLIDQIVVAGGGYPYLTVNAYNVWALVPGDTGNSLANAGVWVCDAALGIDQCSQGTAVFGAIPAIAIGAGALVLSIGTILWVAARRPDRLTLLVALALLALVFYAVPTRVHERYGFPFFALGAILAVISVRWRVAYLVLSVATFANLYVVLTTLYPGNPSIADWLGIGEAIRSEVGVTTVAVLHTAATGWALLQLRRSAAERLEDELAEASLAPLRADRVPVEAIEVAGAPWPSTRTGAPPALAAGTAAGTAAVADVTIPPTWSDRRTFSEAGITGWVHDRLVETPVRADRSRTLVGEGGGRFDRLDVWILAVLFVATLGLRTFRLAEPYQMHFDEVYHARTATEFLQAWRYGESHDIYEWTHPHLAKYAMAGGIVLWGGDQVRATSQLGTDVIAVAHEPRREDVVLGERAGERVHVLTGTELRSYDLRTRALVGTVAAPGVISLAVDIDGSQLLLGARDGTISTIDLLSIGSDGGEPVPLATVDHPVEHLFVSSEASTILAASTDTLTAIDPNDGTVLGITTTLSGVVDLAPAGTGASVVARPAEIEDPAAVATRLADLLGEEAATYEAVLAGDPGPDGQVILGAPGDEDQRTAVEAAITDGSLVGLEILDLPRVAVATGTGVVFLDPATTDLSSRIDLDGGAHGLAMVVGLDAPKLYVTAGPTEAPVYAIVAVGGDDAEDGPNLQGSHPLPGPGTRVTYDEATQQVHVLGLAPVERGPDAGWTVYVIEPHANAVYADAALPGGLEPAGWAVDVEAQYPTDDRQELLLVGTDGTVAAVDMGSHAFAWRMPGVIAGVLMALCLYVLARILFQRRLVAGLVAVFVLLDGMLFVQSRIGMNDAYVAVCIIAAYTLFAAIWTGWWRARWAPWVVLPAIGLLLGLALAAKWVAAYAIGALALLLLVRSALGRVLAIIGLIGISSVLGYLAISVPADAGLGNVAFLGIMVALTLIAVVVAVQHPIAWTDAEQWFAIAAPAALGALVFFGAVALGRADEVVTVGSLAVTPVQVAIALAAGSLVVAAAFVVGGRLGYGPLASPPSADDPRHILEPPAAPPPSWLRPGWALGIPMAWALACLVVVPLVVYVASYIPWAYVENHRLWDGFPAGHTGQTLLELTGQMYNYHNSLSSPHAASSPWWAWPFDLKPVWFYQDSFAGGTTAAVYDAGNLVLWWFGVPAMLFAAVMAYKRRSLALALIMVGFAAQWIPWARIERPAFQYHYYTALPFVLLALAYLLAELWHGASRRTWMAARIAAAAAILGPALLWILSRPLCWFANVEAVNPGSAACPAVIPELVLTVRTLALLAVVAVGVVWLGRAVLGMGRGGTDGAGAATEFRSLLLPAAVVGIGFVVAALLPDTPVTTWGSLPVEPIAVVVALPLAYFAGQVLAARDAHRFVTGFLSAAGLWFLVVYPNIAALPLPSAVVNAYQGILPTYLYAFQFPASPARAAVDAPLLGPTLAVLTAAIAVTCLIVAYSASVWRLALAESAAIASSGAGSSSDDGADGLARTGGGA